jgi:hypothetical protein
MSSSRGNISVALLGIGLFLAAVANLVMVYVARTTQLEMEDLRGRQLRLLCSSAITRLAQQELESGECTPVALTLHPGNVPATLVSRVTYSDDGCFRYLETSVEAEEQSHNLRQVQFQLNEEMQEQGKRFMLISRKPLIGSEFLSEEGIYTSTEEVHIPQIEFLKNTSTAKLSISDLSMEDVKLYGLDKRFYYLSNASTPLIFSKNLKVYGTAVIATEGSIIIESSCQFFDKVVLVSKGNITIKDGVKLPQVLLVAYGKVTIGTGCQLGGVVFSDSNIELLGSSNLINDAEVVARFSSAFYIL